MEIQFKNTASPQTFHVLERHYRPAQSNLRDRPALLEVQRTSTMTKCLAQFQKEADCGHKLTDRPGLHASSISIVQQAGPGSTPNRSMLATPTLKRSAHTSMGTHTYNHSTRESEELRLPQV